jgi:methionyl-tRNA formyltransferase
VREAVDIGAQETTGDLHDRLSAMGARLIVQALGVLDGLVPQVQPVEGVTYASKIDKMEARIDWNVPAAQVDRMIRGLSPAPGAWFEHQDTRIKVLGSHVTEGTGRAGVVLGDMLHVACGSGAVALTRLQRAGKGPQDVDVFQRGAQIVAGTDLNKG